MREAAGGIPIGYKLSAQHIEEDLDAGLFLAQAELAGHKIEIVTKHTDRDSIIRRMQRLPRGPLGEEARSQYKVIRDEVEKRRRAAKEAPVIHVLPGLTIEEV